MTSDRCPGRGLDLSRGLDWALLVLAIAVVAAGACKGSTPARGIGGNDGAVDVPPDGLYVPPPAGRIDTSLDEGWRFQRADVPGAAMPGLNDASAPWIDVTLPHTWNALDGEDGGSNYYRGIGWYRRHLTAPADFTGGSRRQAFLQFDGANIVTDVYLNGTHLGQHRGGFAAFRYDVTSVLNAAGDNVLAVKVDNSPVNDVPPLSADFTFFGGLYRDAHLLTTDPLHVDVEDFASSGVYITPTAGSDGTAEISIRVRVKNAGAFDVSGQMTVTLVDASGVPFLRLPANTFIASAGMTSDLVVSTMNLRPHLWNGRSDPYLYTAYVEIGHDGTVTDLVSQAFGFRSFAVDPNTGFSLNGQPYDLHGVNRHQDRLDMGWAITNREHDQDMALIVEMGATAVRLAHYQHAQHFYDLCDQNGVVAWAEIPLVNGMTASQAFTDNAHQQMTELIRQSYNHPAIIFWSIGNEQRSNDAPTNALLADLASLVATEDPSRLSTYAHCCTSDTSGLPTHSDVVGYNEYFGWYTGNYNQFGAWADGLHAMQPNRSMAVSEYGAGAALTQHADNPAMPVAGGPFHPEEYQALLHEATWKQIAARPFLWGKFIWNMFDFGVDDRNEGDTPGRNDKGMVSYDRLTKKDAFFWYKANWSSDPFVYITGRRFNPRTTATIDVKVYSNLDSVSLTVGGVALPAQTSTDHIFIFPAVPLAAGDNPVSATATRGSFTATDSVTWTRQ
jgi:beta-galactosidase